MHVVERRRGSIGAKVVGRSGAHEVDRGAALRYQVCQLVVSGGHVHHARVIPAGGRKASRTAQINGLLREITGDHG